MSFQNPNMFWWLFALGIPIIVHLFNFRKHKVMLFSNIELLKNLQEQTNRTNRLKHLIVLMLRMLAILALVLAFARPYLPSDNNISVENENLVSVYLDNSMSMQLRGAEMTLLDEAKRKAISLTKSFGMNSRYVLLTNDFLSNHQRPLSPNEFVQEVEKVQSGAPPIKISDVLKRNKTIPRIENFSDRMLFAFSDFQKSSANLKEVPADSSLNLFLIPSKASDQNNIYIDSCWFESPILQAGSSSEIVVRIVNGGSDEAIGIPVRLDINGQQKAVTNVDIQPESSVESRLQFNTPLAGFHEASLLIQDFPIVFDDELFFSFEIRSKVNVLEIYEKQENQWLKLFFEGDDLVIYQTQQRQRLDYQSLSTFDLIFIAELEDIPSGLQQELSQFVDRGGSLVLIPGQNNSSAYNSLSANYGITFFDSDTALTRVSILDENHPLFQNVFVKIPENADFPTVFKHYPIRLEGRSLTNSLIKLLNGDPFLVLNKSGIGKTYAFSTPFNTEWTDFQQNSLFVPVLYRMLLMSTRSNSLYYSMGKTVTIVSPFLRQEESNLNKIRSLSTDFEMIPEHRDNNNRQDLIIQNVVPTAGHYGLFAADSLVQILTWNQDRSESVMSFYSKGELKEDIDVKKFKSVDVVEMSVTEMKDVLNQIVSGQQWFKYFIWMVLILLLTEILILRFWK